MHSNKLHVLRIKIEKISFDGLVTNRKLKIKYVFLTNVNEIIKDWKTIYSSGVYQNCNKFINDNYDKFLRNNKYKKHILLRDVNAFQFFCITSM